MMSQAGRYNFKSSIIIIIIIIKAISNVQDPLKAENALNSISQQHCLMVLHAQCTGLLYF